MQTPLVDVHAPTRIHAHARLIVVLAGCALCLPGCMLTLDDIDRETDRLIAERNQMLRLNATPPSRSGQTDPVDPSAKQHEQVLKPETTNPGAEELQIDTADPARDVAPILLEYASSAAGVGTDLEPIQITLFDALAIAQRTGREHISAEEDYILEAINLLIEQHRWSPRLFNTTSATFSTDGDNGSFQSAANVINDMRVTRRLPFGGDAEARWIWNATEQLRDQVNGRYRQSSTLSANASIPLLRGAGWVARDSLIQAERNLIYAAREFEQFRRDYFFSIARDYLNLLQSKASIANQKRSVESLQRSLEGDIELFDKGRISQFEKSITENQLLSQIASLAQARESYIVQAERFKIRLGLDPNQPVVFRTTIFDLQEPTIALDEAVDVALSYRLDWQNTLDRLDDSRRAIRLAEDGLLPDLDLTLSASMPTEPDAREGGLGFSPEDVNASAGISLSLPLDRKTEQLRVRQARIRYDQSQRNADRSRDNLALDVRSSVRAIELARFQLTLAEKQVDIANSRVEEQSLRQDITSQERVDTQDTLLRALNARDRARTDLRIAILQYLLNTGQMRVTREGLLEALPGMDILEVKLYEDISDIDEWFLDPPKLNPETEDATEPDPSTESEGE
ncbi:MAG: TolC family protein [Phycisphaeraceae bacterium]|nr:TolC family protein [Phycisphaerales bacterium]MCB9859927.1 TolC family protein [Phycisphaeraceae bacterium]